MDDYSGLAARVAAGVGGLRGCLILSRDGLVLGAHPDDDDRVAKPSWLRFAALGEPERSFVEFGDQVWVYVRRGPYAAFAVADAGVRPGLVIDQLEQGLLMAEESRTKREGLRAPEAAPAAGPRTTLHPPVPPTVTPTPAPVPAAARTAEAPPAEAAEAEQATPPTEPAAAAGEGDRAEPPATPEPPKHEAPKLMTTPVTPVRSAGSDEDAEVDKVLLAQEFSGLLQDLDSDDEGSS